MGKTAGAGSGSMIQLQRFMCSFVVLAIVPGYQVYPCPEGMWSHMPEYEMLAIAIVCSATVIMAVIAILHKNLIRAVGAYAISSLSLAGLFFLLSSPYAGALELTVGAGLVAVLFLVALILAGGAETEVPS